MHAVLLQYNMEKNRIFLESALNMGEILNLYQSIIGSDIHLRAYVYF